MNDFRWIFIILLFSVSLAHASEPTQLQMPPKTFQTWKDLQVLEAQNQVLRVSARISQIKSGKGAGANVKEPAHLSSARVKTMIDADPLSLAEKDLRSAKESLDSANSLELTDYVNIYLPSLESQPEALQVLVQKLTKDELGEILKVILSKNTHLDTKRNPPVISGLSVGTPSTN